MNDHSRSVWNLLGSLLKTDKELFSGFFVAIVLLVGEIAVPESLKLGLRGFALFMLAFGLTWFIRNHIRTARFMVSDKHIPLVFVTSQPRREAVQTGNEARRAVTEHTGFDQFKKMEDEYNVHYEDLISHRADNLPPDPAEWLEFLEDSREEIGRFVQHVQGGRIYHVFLRGPSTLAFGVGAILGTKNRVVGYQHDGVGYNRVLDLTQDIRRVKTQMPDDVALKFINVTYPPGLTEETSIVLDLAGHVATGDAESYLENHLPGSAVVNVNGTYGGNLTAANWVPVVQELYQVFHRIQRDHGVRQVHVFHAMPGMLALGMGMALGNFMQVTIYNWERAEATYHPVLDLNQIEAGL